MTSVKVWPADFNWQSVPVTNFHSPLETTSAFYLPWMMSLAWMTSGRNGYDRNSFKLEERFAWSLVDFAYPSAASRDLAMSSGNYIPSANLPLGLETYGGRLFLTFPRWKKGIPVTLGYVPLNSKDKSPVVRPYPSWDWHAPGNCLGLTSVFRLSVDECGRLWVIDSGITEIASAFKKSCPAQILAFDLKTDELIWRYKLPKKQVTEGGLFTNIAVDVITCDRTYVYVSDVFRYSIVVYDFANDRSWRLDHPYFYPDPLHSKYVLDDITFRWNDGIFGMTLSPIENDTRYLYFHPMSSFREFRIDTKTLHNETLSMDQDNIKLVGSPRREKFGHSSGEAMDRNGVLFYNLVSLSSVGCWNSKNPHFPDAHAILERSNVTLSFPNDLRVDHEPEQRLWVLSNRLHRYLYGQLDTHDFNYRVLTAKTDDIVVGTRCQAEYRIPPRRAKKCQEL